MTAINTSRKLRAVLAAALSLLIIVCMMSVPAFAAEDTTAAETTTVAETTSEAATTEATTTKAETESTASAVDAEAKTRGIINLAVGGVILVVLVVLCIVFRHKIPGFARSMKSETGKIVWCPKDQLKKKAVVVIITILALILIIALLDFAFSEGLQLLRQATAGLRK
ncbi:MAG: preprotein translocase subunit SecE [Ruminococcaceae bacterium]|nr:preprotein translocase subunit SecE [Oscillospiraceae bacterium]